MNQGPQQDGGSLPGEPTEKLPTVESIASPEAALLVEVAQLREALGSRDIIGQAKGIIRLLVHCDSDEAFDLLRHMSQDTNHKLRDVAALVAERAASGVPLPEDVSASWRRLLIRRTAQPSDATSSPDREA